MHDDICVRLGARIRELREARGLSRLHLAHCCGFELADIKAFEVGTREIHLKNLATLADRLGVSLASLLAGLKF